MPSTRDIRRRIKSVKNTAQITKAMQMVASSKMQKAQQGAINYRPFAAMAGEIMDHLAVDTADYRHPLMETREVRKRAVIIISTDKGLCGGLNSQPLPRGVQVRPRHHPVRCRRQKAAQFLARTKRKLVAEFTYHDTPTYSARPGHLDVRPGHVPQGRGGRGGRALHALHQHPVPAARCRALLPMARPRVCGPKRADQAAQGPAEHQRDGFPFRAGPGDGAGRLVLYFVNFQVCQLLLEAKASEHSARMVAMKNATDNAKQLIKDLTLEYNKMRQASITKELLEIASAAMALG